MDPVERSRHLETLKETQARLKAAVRGVPKKLLLWRPAPGKWSILEIVCHMRDMERDAYLERYRRILAEDNPALPDIDGDLYTLERDYRSAKLAEVVRDWARLRKECLKVLRGVKGERWQRVGTHPTAGPLSVETFLWRQAVGNDAAHLAQIEAIKQRSELLARLEPGPARLGQAIKGVTDEALRRRPAEGKWSILEIACHMRDVEQVYVERMAKAAFQGRPAFWAMDNDALAEKRGYNGAEPAAVLGDFKRLRAETLGLLRSLPHAVWQRAGTHPTRGELTIEALARSLAGHDDSHLGRLGELRG